VASAAPAADRRYMRVPSTGTFAYTDVTPPVCSDNL
jgi:hypothetical protein